MRKNKEFEEQMEIEDYEYIGFSKQSKEEQNKTLLRMVRYAKEYILEEMGNYGGDIMIDDNYSAKKVYFQLIDVIANLETANLDIMDD